MSPKNSELKMLSTKINSGKFKNRSIFLPNTPTTRPSKNIVRQAFFNTIKVLDLDIAEVFAGSGCIALEALSLGARSAAFFEQNAQAIGVLKKNIELLGVQNARIIAGDSFENFLPFVDEYTSDALLVYLDPPFNIRENYAQIYERLLDLIIKMDAQKVRFIVIEHHSKVVFAQQIGSFASFKVREFGKTTLSYFRPLDGT